MKIFIALFTLIPLIFMSFGVGGIWSQHRKVTTYLPVRATVLSTDVQAHVSRGSHGSTSTTYSPEVKYSYEVSGRMFTRGKVLPLDMSAGRRWAEDIAGRYRPRQSTEAYFNLADPADAFLVRQYSFFPPLSSVTARGQRSLMIAGAWLVVGVLVCGHYFIAATRPYETEAIVAGLIYAAIGCVPLGMAVYFTILHRHIADARVFVNTPRFVLGDEVAMLIQQPVFTDLEVKEMNVSLVCRETNEVKSGNKSSISTRDCLRDSAVVIQNQRVRSRETLSATHTLRFPANQQPSTLPGEKGYPRFDWLIEVKADIPHGPDYHGKFPLVVVSPAIPSPGAAV